MMRGLMGLLPPKEKRDPSARSIALALVAGVPFVAYLATASAHGHWLDSGEFVAAAVHLDISHPPGHPLASLFGKLMTLLPLGSIPFRVALGQALCAALAAGFLYSALETTARALGLVHDRVVIPLALGGTWLAAMSLGFWLQAVRPEVYALEALLVFIAVERIIALEAAWPSLDLRPIYVAALALGLGLANHHLVAFLVFPALAPTMARVFRARGARPLLYAGFALALGASVYVYLPVRAATGPPANLGDPSTVGNFFWVVSAKVYQSSHGLSPQPLFDRYAELLIQFVDQLHVATLLVALAGAWAILRTPGARRIGVVWLLVAGASVLARGWLGFVADNPDALGYLMPAYGGVVALAMAFVAALFKLLAGPRVAPHPLLVMLALAFAGTGLWQLHRTAEPASLASFHATDDFDDERVRRLPLGAVVVAHDPQTVFRHYSVQAVERTRPDVSIVPLPFLAYPGVAQAIATREPDLADLVRGYLLEGELRQPDLQSLAARRPIRVEMDVRVPPALYETLLPAGLFHEATDAGTTRAEILEASGPHHAALQRLYLALGDQRDEPETSRRLLWLHYNEALHFAGVGAREPAVRALAAAARISPESPELRGLAEALREGEGPIDVRPFRVGE